jgi:hypothetical protein
MRVATQIQVYPMVGRIRVHLGRMDQKDFKRIRRDLTECDRQIRAAIVMGIIHPYQPDTLGTLLHVVRLVEQHLDAEAFQLLYHLEAVMIAQHTRNSMPGVNPGENPCHTRIDMLTIAFGFEAIVTGQHAKINI